MSSSPCILYKQPEAWGLPSLSPGCIQAETYLRLANVDFWVDTCTSTSQSPTCQLPAIERDPDICTGVEDEGVSAEFAACHSVITFVKQRGHDLDHDLTTSQKAQLLAFSTLVETRLEVATAYTTWCEPHGFAEVKKAAYAGKLPFPLSYILPWSKQREMRRKLGQLAAGKVYEDACAAIEAVSEHLKASSAAGPYFFGARPSSLDALLAGHLLYYRQSAAVAPVLQEKVSSSPAITRYLDHLTAKCFASSAPSVGGASTPRPGGPDTASAGGSSWSDAGKGQRPKSSFKQEPSAAERRSQRIGTLWLVGACTAIAAYVLLSGQYIQVTQLQELFAGGDDDGGDDGDDDDGDE